jgi:hypothetical protein
MIGCLLLESGRLSALSLIIRPPVLTISSPHSQKTPRLRFVLFVKDLLRFYFSRLVYIPSPFRIFRTIFIPKVGMADYTDCGSFHPISLVSFCFKTLERLVHLEMENTALKSHPFHPHQHGFCRVFGTDTALSEVVNFVEQGILKNKRVLAVFLDIKGAFDNASSKAIRKAMEDHGYPTVFIFGITSELYLPWLNYDS